MLESSPEPRSDRIAMGALLSRFLADAEALSGGRHKIRLDVQGNFDLLGSETEIAGALSNLVTNAIRYTPAGGEIRILWQASDEVGVFSVEDTGIGIESEHIPRLTERFYRVDRSRSRETGGTGLGLAIVKHALLRHQADLNIESKPGEGSKFSVAFPARRLIAAQTSFGVTA
jgi:two-component system phosphate regulon sensor histidine kinase PhoR